MTALLHSRCTITTRIFITKQSLIFCVTNAADRMPWSSRALQRPADNNSLSIGVAIPPRPLSPWRKPCAADYRLDYQGSDFGAMILADLNKTPARMYINAGLPLVCSLLTAVCMAVPPIVFPGIMTKKPSVYYPNLRSSNVV